MRLQSARQSWPLSTPHGIFNQEHHLVPVKSQAEAVALVERVRPITRSTTRVTRLKGVRLNQQSPLHDELTAFVNFDFVALGREKSLSIRGSRRIKQWSARIRDDRPAAVLPAQRTHELFRSAWVLWRTRAVLRGRSRGNASGTRTRTRPRTGKSNARLCDDHPKRSTSDPGEPGEKHRSRQAVRRRPQNDRQMEGA